MSGAQARLLAVAAEWELPQFHSAFAAVKPTPGHTVEEAREALAEFLLTTRLPQPRKAQL